MARNAQVVDSSPERMERLLTVADAAAYFAVSRRQVYVLLDRGELPAVRVGSRLRLIPADLRDYVQRHREAP
jgi:excisionase family DNA binding protein